MRGIPPIKSVMTPFPYSVELDAPLSSVQALMDEHAIRHVAVTEDQVLVGVVSDRDLKRSQLHGSLDELIARDAYRPDPYVVDLNEPLDNVLVTMAERHIGSALVMRQGRLAGVFTATDACRVFGRYLRDQFHPGGGDEAA